MDNAHSKAIERIKVVLFALLCFVGFFALISEAETLIWFIATKVTAAICFITAYKLDKTIDMWKL